VALAVATAIVSASIQLAVEAVRRTSSHSPLGHHADALWMAPLGNLLVLLPVAGVVLLVRRFAPNLVPRSGAALLFTLGWMGALLPLPGLKPVALVLLSVGLGLQGSRLLGRWPRGSAGFMRGVAITGALSLLLYALLLHGTRRLGEAGTLAALPGAPEGAPNILLLVLDTVRNPSLSLFGYPRATSPVLERVAREGTRFDQAFATSSWTLPSHAGIFTGRYPHELNAGFRASLDARWPTLAEALRERGYATAGFIANRMYTSRASGLARGFAHYSDVAVAPGEVVASSALLRTALRKRQARRLLDYHDLFGRRNAAELNAAFLDWLPRAGERPFFAFINYYDAHNPYLPPEPWDRRFTRDTSRYEPPVLDTTLSEAEIAREREAYEGAIAWLDHQVGALLDSLRGRGLLDRTLVIITSDHGEQFGEHGMVDHGNTLYRVLLQVPLLLRQPGTVPEGRAVLAPVSLRELPQTVLDLAGLGPDTTFPGRSLARHWREPVERAEPILSELTWPDGEIAYSLIEAGHHWIEWFGGRVELYDLRRDSLELSNLTPAGADSADWARRRLRLTGPVTRGPERD